MPKSLKIIQICDHVIEVTEYIDDSSIVTRGATAADVITTDGLVTEITNVQDSTYIYTEDIDYSLVGTNEIMWLNPNTEPALSATYTVSYKLLSTNRTKYSQAECPRCASRGWYVDIISVLGKLAAAENLFKLAQDVVKALLTEQVDNYGSEIPSLVGSSEHDEMTKTEIIVSSLNDVEQQIKLHQAELVSEGVALLDEEKLYKIVLKDSYIDDSGSISAEILILSESGRKAVVALSV